MRPEHYDTHQRGGCVTIRKLRAMKNLFLVAFFVGALFAPSAARAAEPAPLPLSLQQAQDLAIKNHPRITEADLLALASRQAVREARSAYYPVITGDATAVGAVGANTRIAAGGLNNPLILDRDAEGVTVNQIITDFGRSINLSASAKLTAQAREQEALATREEILLEVNSAYFAVLHASSVLEVANQTVATRQLTFNRVSELATNQLRSGLDAAFAKVDLEQGNLLVADAQNEQAAANARLADVLGERRPRNYQLADQTAMPAAPPDNEQLLQTALQNRPDLMQFRLEQEAADRFARAENDLNYPTISAVGAAGVIPVHDPLLKANYAAAGVNLSLPIFDGFLFSAKKQEAGLRARAASEKTRDAEDNVVRDVTVAAANVALAARRVTLTGELLATASQAFDLADDRYRAGSSSIVELSQAQLGKTQAQIDAADAKYDYLLQTAILNFQTGALH
jgi:outer membrane protein